MEDWVCIHAFSKLYEAEMAHNVLTNNNIVSVLINKQDSLYLIGEIELYVKPDDVIKAKFILKEPEL